MTILAHHYLDELEHREALLWWQERGLSYTASGYGRRIPTRYMVKLPGNKRWRRVYRCQISNAGTCYVLQGSDWIVIE